MKVNVADFLYEEMQPAHIPEACALIYRLYARYIASDFSPRSRTGMEHYLSESSLSARLGSHHFALICRLDTPLHTIPGAHPPAPANPEATAGSGATANPGAIIGMIEVREFRHITLLFVDDNWQRHGIARTFIELAVARCHLHRPTLPQITVRATPSAIPIYTRLGFEPDPARADPDSPALYMRRIPEGTA